MRIKTRRLLLRGFKREDLVPLFSILSDPRVMFFMEKTYTLEETSLFLESHGLCASPSVFAAEDLSGGFCGYVIYNKYGETAFELGWVLGKEHWGKGYAKELTSALIEYSKGKTQSLVLECSPKQKATARIASLFGFVYEGCEDGLDVYRLKL